MSLESNEIGNELILQIDLQFTAPIIIISRMSTKEYIFVLSIVAEECPLPNSYVSGTIGMECVHENAISVIMLATTNRLVYPHDERSDRIVVNAPNFVTRNGRGEVAGHITVPS